MNYAYDILVNLQNKPYDFFEWDLKDNIIHVKKIPLIKIATEKLRDIVKNKVKIEKKLLNKLCGKTEVFVNNAIKEIKFSGLFLDSNEAFIVEFDNNGIKTKISKMLYDEEVEILEVGENILELNIEYEIIKKEKDNLFRTRKDNEKYNFILKNLIKIDFNKLKYLYFECFDNEEEDYNKIIKSIKKELEINWEEVNNKIYNILKLSSQKQQ